MTILPAKSTRLLGNYRLSVEEAVRQITTLEGECSALRDYCQNQNRMLASLVHDMRSPMTVILAAAQLASLPHLKEEKRLHNLHLVQDAARQLQSLIQDILDFSKLQVGTIELSLQVFHLRGLLESVIEGQKLVALPPVCDL